MPSHSSSTRYSTNVRNLAPLAFRVGATVLPGWTAERAIDWFLATTRRPPTGAQAVFRDSGERVVLDADGDPIVARVWGSGPLVLFLHGWNGSLTDFRHLVPAVVDAGFRVVAVDAVGHGESTGDASSAIHLARALVAAGDAFGPAAAVVAHSLGAAAAAWAVSRGTVRTERLILVAPAAEPNRYVERMAGDLGDAFAGRLLRTLADRVGVSPVDLALTASSPGIDRPVVVFHDTDDHDTRPAPVARAVSGWPSARLVRTDGLGHRKILADDAISAAIVDVLKGTNVRTCSHDRLPTRCTACALERELYHRDDRAA